MPTKLRKVYQLKIQLLGVKPPIWRRVQVLDSTTLNAFHHICQVVMGWENYHLYEFAKGNSRYGPIAPEDEFMDEELKNEDNYKLKDLLKNEKDKLEYEYDFGDGWEHKITLEKILTFTTDKKLPVCIKAVRGCPPEDVGGVWGYEEFLEAWSDKNHSEHDEMKEWAGDDFHPENYDLEETNQCLIEMFHGA